jgi:sulfur relay (sulfurtransferase) DsrC/TusE family protein
MELGGKQVEIDEDGFIQDPDVWDEGVAKSLAGASTTSSTTWRR